LVFHCQVINSLITSKICGDYCNSCLWGDKRHLLTHTIFTTSILIAVLPEKLTEDQRKIKNNSFHTNIFMKVSSTYTTIQMFSVFFSFLGCIELAKSDSKDFYIFLNIDISNNLLNFYSSKNLEKNVSLFLQKYLAAQLLSAEIFLEHQISISE